MWLTWGLHKLLMESSGCNYLHRLSTDSEVFLFRISRGAQLTGKDWGKGNINWVSQYLANNNLFTNDMCKQLSNFGLSYILFQKC